MALKLLLPFLSFPTYNISVTKTTRRILFYGFVAVFILTTPPTILYAMGYSFDWQKYALVQTGGLYLKSTPNGAQIAINGKNKNTTPRLVSHLRPSFYEITISKNDFYPWQKTLEVLPGLVTEARNIMLFPRQTKKELSADNATSTIEYYLNSPSEKQKEILAQNIASSTAGWLLKNDNIFYISKANFILYRTDLSGSVKEQISKEPLPPDSAYQLISSDGKIFTTLSSKGALAWLNNKTGIFETINNQIKTAEISSDNKRIVYSTDNEIWIFYLQDILIQPYKSAGDKELITRLAQKISQVIFYSDNEHLAFVVGDQIKIIELDGRDQRNTIDLIEAPQPKIYFDDKNNYLYYLTQNQLFRINLNY